MSVITITPERFDTISKTIEHLSTQTIKEQLEILVVAPKLVEIEDSLLNCFYKYRVVEIGEISSTGKAIATGVRLASAPVVVYVEEHSYPEPGWAEALINAHRKTFAAVGAAVANANPHSMISWAGTFSDFGPWVDPSSAKQSSKLATHQTSYKRDILLKYGSGLGAMMEVESLLHLDLHKRGYKLYLEPSAKIRHLSISKLSSYLNAEFHGGRTFGAARAKYGNWSMWRRLIYILASPAIPFKRLIGTVQDIFESNHQDLLPAVLPPLIMGLCSHSIGELAGYAFGAGNAPKKRIRFELNRDAHISNLDRKNIANS